MRRFQLREMERRSGGVSRVENREGCGICREEMEDSHDIRTGSAPFAENGPVASGGISAGFVQALEKLLKDVAGKFATSDEAQLGRYPTLARLKEAYDEHPAFIAALPTNQPDAPTSS
ncbi:Glutathione S-transferase Z1 [Dendrobium catenatum]|uniref:Glutathione S-transferase Z1 n=1 Tax=Dendrobium catenatum TaxID=906689 RepID=A0A2I0VS53_9ASPA|nr:Glutathione S-transferase Z1 [Dendrobium catenatum]